MATADTSEHPAVAAPSAEAADELLSVYVRRQGGQWHATAIDYSIVASGDTPEEAARKLAAMVDDYRELCARDGVSPADARRPLPPRWSGALLLDIARYALRLALHRGRHQPGGQWLVPRHGC
jgi:hypothetical protein